MQPNLNTGNITEMKLSTADGKRSVDIMNLFVELQIFEEIFKPYTYGFVFINDTINLLNTLPILGEEILEISFYGTMQPNSKRTYKFWVYSVLSPAINLQNSNQAYKLEFISFDQLNNNKNLINYKCKGLISDSINALCTQYLTKPLKYLPTTTQCDYLVPLSTPTDCIMFLTKQARNTNTKDADNYVFYEAQDTYVFGSIEQLKKQAFQNLATRQASGEDINLYVGQHSQLSLTGNTAALAHSAKQVTFSNFKDTFTGLKNGELVNIYNVYDISSRQFFNFTSDYTAAFDSTSHINKSAGFMKQSVYFTGEFNNTAPFLKTIIGDSSKPDFDVVIPTGPIKEIYSFLFFEGSVIMEIPGDSSISLADVYKLSLPERTPYKQEQDAFRSDYYMVGRMVHKFKMDEYDLVLSLFTDNFNSSVETVLSKATF
jgi:hypothetical protein